MSQLVSSLVQGQNALAENLTARLRDLVFENRYSLHPRRITAIAAALSASFLGFVRDPAATDPGAQGEAAARDGLGSKSVLAAAETVRAHCRGIFETEPALLDLAVETAERFCSALLQGFMKMEEALILQDQEQLRRALSSALEKQSRDLLVKNHAVNTTINGILLTDLDGRVTWVNASFLALWGYGAADEVAGMPLAAFWAEEERPRAAEVLLSSSGWRGELVARRRDGGSFNVEVAASIIRNEEGAAIGIMTSFVDATERKRLQAQVIQAQKMEALGQLAGGIAHDFNNLLTAIGGYVQLVMAKTPRDSRMHKDLVQVQAAVERGTGLTRQLRFFTRQTAGVRTVVSLNDTVRETLEILRHAFPPEIGIRLDLEPALDLVEADPNQLSQVLINLCVNARDAMTEPGRVRGGTLVISTSNVPLAEERVGRYCSAKPGRYVAVRVKDTGAGISPEVQDRLFIPFVTTKGMRSGTGLGLAVVYGIVTNHEGFIDVRSAPGAGTEFELLFPRTSRARETATSAPAPDLERGRGTVLVVDDEQQIREIMSRVLVDCGYTVITAGDGAEALDRFGTGAGIDLVVLDIVMPNLGGKECLTRLRERRGDVRVLVTTGHTSEGAAREMVQRGALDIIEKPLDLKAFARAVARHVSAA